MLQLCGNSQPDGRDWGTRPVARRQVCAPELGAAGAARGNASPNRLPLQGFTRLFHQVFRFLTVFLACTFSV